MTFEQALSSVSFFAGVDPADLGTLASLGRPCEAKKGDPLFREGEVANHLFYLERGRVEIARHHLHFGKQTYAVLSAPAAFGALALFYDEPHFSTATALDACRLVVLHHEDVLSVLADHPRLARAVAAGMASSLRSANEEIRRMTSQFNRSVRPLLKLPPLERRETLSTIHSH